MRAVNAGNVFGIAGFLDFVHRPEFQINRKHNVLVTGTVSVFS
jgi:hypothetical protein